MQDFQKQYGEAFQPKNSRVAYDGTARNACNVGASYRVVDMGVLGAALSPMFP